MGKKFDAIFEAVVSRYQVGGYLPGDLVKFRPNYKSTPCYNAMHSIMKKELDEIVNSGLNIRVTQIGSKRQNVSYALDARTADEVVISIAADHLGGSQYGAIAVTPDMIDIVDAQNPSPPIPDSLVYKDRSTFKPEEYKADPNNITRVTDRGNGKNVPTDLKLAGESTRLKMDNDNMATLYENI
jgi:hypothetical protein